MSGFTMRPAVREQVPLLIGLTAPSGGGKTVSALRLAQGIQSVVGGEIALIDTENRRALHYAETFRFQHIQFDPPFGSLRYLEAIQHAVSHGARTVIVDSTSHEHDAVGGMLDYHEQELTRMAGDDYKKRESMTMLAWQKPKQARRRLLQGITRFNANIILCFRARETSKPVRANGKTTIVPMGFTPICGDEFVYEMSLSMLLLPGADGVPTWETDNPGEKMAIKLPGQFRDMFAQPKPLDEDIGAQLARWSVGGAAPTAEQLIENGRKVAEDGGAALQTWWRGLPAAGRASVEAKAGKVGCPDELKKIASEADKPPPSKPEPNAVTYAELMARIRAAKSADDLEQIKADCGHLPQDQKAEILAAIDARRMDLQEAA